MQFAESETDPIEETLHLLAVIDRQCPDESISMTRALNLISAIRSHSETGSVTTQAIDQEFSRQSEKYGEALRHTSSAPDGAGPALVNEIRWRRTNLYILRVFAQDYEDHLS